MFNLKNVENQKTFDLITLESKKFSECFSNEKSFTEQCDQCKNSLFSSIKQSFNKIRITTKPKITEIRKLIGERNFLKQKMKRSTEEETNNLKLKIEEAEKKISKLSAKENVQKIKDNFVKFSDSDGSFKSNGMWNVKRKIFPKNPFTLPVAKLENQGRLISSPEELINLYIYMYIDYVIDQLKQDWNI